MLTAGVAKNAVRAIGIAALLCLAAPALAALSASATISTSSGSSPYDYSITLTNNGSTGIGAFWFAWTRVPAEYNFLPTMPTNISAPAGWSYYPTGPNFAGDGYGIEYYTFSPLAAGQALSGFNFTSTLAPGHLGDAASNYPDPIDTSAVFATYITTGSGVSVAPTVVPEPATAVLAVMAALIGCMARRRRFVETAI